MPTPAQEHLVKLVDQMEKEADSVIPDAYERVLAEWRSEE